MKHFFRVKSDFVCNVCVTLQRSGFISQYNSSFAICDGCVGHIKELCNKDESK